MRESINKVMAQHKDCLRDVNFADIDENIPKIRKLYTEIESRTHG